MVIRMEDNACLICGLPSGRRCSACGKAVYCCLEHQKEHWKVHKLKCVSYKISVNQKVGRHLIATRNIPAGTIILIDKPIVLGPKLYSLPICLGCYKKVNGSYFCTQCGFPVCSAECEKIEAHKNNECRIFAKRGSTPKKIENYEISHPLFQSILPLRCLLLSETFPEKWKTLSTMEHHLEERRLHSEVWEEYQVNIVSFLRDWHALGEIYSEDTVNRVIGFIEVNSFQIKTVKKIEMCGLFRLGGMMSHDCTPNTHHAFTPEGNLILRASVNIKKNSGITMSYVDPLTGTGERRQILEQSKYFGCDCLRCSDPTEFGTFISGIKCKSCEDGYLLQKIPLVVNSPWVCSSSEGNRICASAGVTLSPSEINSKLEQGKAQIRALLSSDNVAHLESQLSLQCQNFHPNHFLLLPVWKHLLDVCEIEIVCRGYNLTNQSGEKYIADLTKIKRLAENLLNVYNILDPGLTRGRGLLLRQLYTVEQLLKFEESETEAAAGEERLLQLKTEIQNIFELDNLIQEKN